MLTNAITSKQGNHYMQSNMRYKLVIATEQNRNGIEMNGVHECWDVRS